MIEHELDGKPLAAVKEKEEILQNHMGLSSSLRFRKFTSLLTEKPLKILLEDIVVYEVVEMETRKKGQKGQIVGAGPRLKGTAIYLRYSQRPFLVQENLEFIDEVLQ